MSLNSPLPIQPEQVRQGTEDVREKGSDVVAGADRTTHKASVKGGRLLGERMPEKVRRQGFW